MLYTYNVPKRSHSKKQVRDALTDAAAAGFEVVPSDAHGHSWGYLDCPHPDCTQRFYVWSTPADADEHAKQIRRFVRRNEHKED